MRYRLLPVLAGAAALIAACSDDVVQPGQVATVQFVNASSGTPTAEITLGGRTLTSGLAYQGASTTCIHIPAGAQTLSFTSGGSAVASAAATTFEGGQGYTVVLTGTGASRAATVLPTTLPVAVGGTNNLRFINATGARGDIFVTSATGATSGTPSVGGLAAGQATGGATGTNAFVPFPAANTRVRFVTAGTTGIPWADFSLSTVPWWAGATTVVFTPAASRSPTAFQVDPCY